MLVETAGEALPWRGVGGASGVVVAAVEGWGTVAAAGSYGVVQFFIYF